MNGLVQSVILLGEQSLVIQCGERLILKGWDIKCLVSKDSAIKNWCLQKNIPHLDSYQKLEGTYSEESVDYVFSITNLKLLPDWLLKIGRRAINFHDGPLPRYAGLNVPVWAILNDETEHGITWHEMTTNVDAGQILAQQLFPIIPGETALSINAKCYQTALESFEKLIDELIEGTNQPKTQNQEVRSYFGLVKRPEAAGIIDWTKSAAHIDRLVRGLDYGNYANPLVTVKILIGDDVIVVRKTTIINSTTTYLAGKIIEHNADTIQVSCGQGIIELSEFYSQSGENYPCAISLLKKYNVSNGDQLPNGSDVLMQNLSDRVKEVCRYESFWVKELLNAESVSIPYAKKVSASDSGILQRAPFALPASVLGADQFQNAPLEYTISILAALLSRLNSKTNFTLSVLSKEDELVKSFFATCLPLEVNVDEKKDFASLLSAVKVSLSMFSKAGALLSDIWLREPALKGHSGLDQFSVKLAIVDSIDEIKIDEQLKAACETSELVLLLEKSGQKIELCYRDSVIDENGIKQLTDQLLVIATEAAKNTQQSIEDINILSDKDISSINEWNSTELNYDKNICLHHLIERQADTQANAIALAYDDDEISYQVLNSRSNQVARFLLERGAKEGGLIGVMMDRSIDMVVTLVAIHKLGCAYVPLDPVYPSDRLRYMVEDSELSVLVTESRHANKLGELDAQVIVHNELDTVIKSYPEDNLAQSIESSSLAYVIYTSGSTGKPKGVMVEHQNVVNFFVGMDAVIGTEKGTWLAVTSISFDISVLEIFWTLSRGFKVIIYRDKQSPAEFSENENQAVNLNLDYSFFYWNVADEESLNQTNKYKLLLEGAKFADKHEFKAVWNPERHFGSFGGLFPNPSVTLAALSTITEKVDLRAGSCVIPLHSPIRVAEEWSVLDNLSNGRVGIAVAAGWAPPDFAIKPESYPEAKQVMFDSLELVRRLWRGEKVNFPGPTGDVEIRTLPLPIQKELPIWITTAGNPESFKSAAKMGANVLTHLLGQTFEEVQEKIDTYRAAWKDAGHAGEGTISLMLHTFIGESMEEVEEIVRAPMKNYLKSAMFLVKSAAWNFPTFKKMSEDAGKSLDEFFETISDEDMDDLLEFSFQRYFKTSGLFGTPESAIAISKRCKEIGVDEIACLIDFGIDTDTVIKHLPYLNKLRINTSTTENISSQSDSQTNYSLPDLIEKHNVTHFQCTPSMATILLAEPESKAKLAYIKHMMVGGEALPSVLANELRAAIGGRLTNMYGPTETTIWSSIFDVNNDNEMSIGKAIANTQIYIVDQNLRQLPVGVAGELLIGGDGVVRGYHNRPKLTDERFIPDQFKNNSQGRVYRTGDLAKYSEDGRLLYLGRIDHQVKVRGYRIELGEIESLLQTHDSIRECAVILRDDKTGDKRLVAYVRPNFEKHVDVDALKAHLSGQLPEFMVPAFYVELASMPLTPNGKLDRNALPEPIQQRHQNSEEFALPEDDWEKLIADIWKKALGVEEVGRKDNFFDIGGHSLLVIQVLKELRESEKVTKSVQMTDLFRFTTIESIAKFVAADESESAASEVTSSRVAARKAAQSRRRRR
jgi:natural product biosynthesis luciferase-like monooxygenase protein